MSVSHYASPWEYKAAAPWEGLYLLWKQCILASLHVRTSPGSCLKRGFLGPVSGDSHSPGLEWALGSCPLRKLPFDSDAQQVWDLLIQITFLSLKLAVRNILLLKILSNWRETWGMLKYFKTLKQYQESMVLPCSSKEESNLYYENN